MVIDAHQHVYYHGRNPDAVVAEMDRFGIDRAWILTWILPPGEDVPGTHGVFNPRNFRTDGTHAGSTLDDVIEACARHPDRFIAGYCPCPAEGSAPALFEAAVEMYGVRICGEWSYRMLLDDPRALELFRTAGRLGCPVVLHIDTPYLPDREGRPVYQPTWYGGEIDALERALAACPETVFIGHAPGFWRHISGDADRDPAVYPSGPIEPGGRLFALFEAYPNLYADLSAGSGLNALRRDSEHARAFLICYADRLLYGRDAPGNDLLEYLATLDLPKPVRERILSGNAERLLSETA